MDFNISKNLAFEYAEKMANSGYLGNHMLVLMKAKLRSFTTGHHIYM